MFEGGILKRLSEQNILVFLGEAKEQRELWIKRLARIVKRCEREPDWKYTHPQTDCEITISELLDWSETEAGIVDENIQKLEDEFNRRKGLNQTIPMF